MLTYCSIVCTYYYKVLPISLHLDDAECLSLLKIECYSCVYKDTNTTLEVFPFFLFFLHYISFLHILQKY